MTKNKVISFKLIKDLIFTLITAELVYSTNQFFNIVHLLSIINVRRKVCDCKSTWLENINDLANQFASCFLVSITLFAWIFQGFNRNCGFKRCIRTLRLRSNVNSIITITQQTITRITTRFE